jgi:hypothetical protein
MFDPPRDVICRSAPQTGRSTLALLTLTDPDKITCCKEDKSRRDQNSTPWMVPVAASLTLTLRVYQCNRACVACALHVITHVDNSRHAAVRISM